MWVGGAWFGGFGFDAAAEVLLLMPCWWFAVGVMVTYCVADGLVCCLGDYVYCFSLLVWLL